MNAILRMMLSFWWEAKEFVAVLVLTFVGVVVAVDLLNAPLVYYALAAIGWFGGQWAIFTSPKYSVEKNY